MGTTRLKKKDEVNYRRGGESMNCGGCDCFVPAFQETGLGGALLDITARCTIIGLGNGRLYRISARSVCDSWNNRKSIEKLRGKEWNGLVGRR